MGDFVTTHIIHQHSCDAWDSKDLNSSCKTEVLTSPGSHEANYDSPSPSIKLPLEYKALNHMVLHEACF